MYSHSRTDLESVNIMLLKFKDLWYIECDLIYNLNFPKKMCEAAKYIFNDSESYMKKETAIQYIDISKNINAFNSIHISVIS